jgi:hypothetical protein
MRSAVTATIWSCLPRIMCGPFCSMPPLGTMARVYPASMAVRTSTQVMSAIRTVDGNGAVSGRSASMTATAMPASTLTPSFHGESCRAQLARRAAGRGAAECSWSRSSPGILQVSVAGAPG